MERGYTNDMKKLTDHVQKLVDAGVAAINLEDSDGDTTYLKKLSSIKNYLEKATSDCLSMPAPMHFY